jgi:hypothetical protein
MAVDPQFSAALQAIDDVTSRLGAGVTTLATALDGVSTRVAALMGTLSTRMTDAEVAAAKSTLDTETNKIDAAVTAFGGIATALDGVAADGTTAVPSVPATPKI